MLIDLVDDSEAREDDENFKDAVDLLFEELEQKNPNHFAVRQYKTVSYTHLDVYKRQVWNGLTNEFHPTQMLADMLTIREHLGRLKGCLLYTSYSVWYMKQVRIPQMLRRQSR